MPRVARIVVKDYPHHITQRCNYRQTVFASDKDYVFYLQNLNEYANKYKLSILAYCLMPNHVHFIAVPKEKDSLAKTFNACHMKYSHHSNKKRRRIGHLWQGRFYSCVLDEGHLYGAIRYVENNPVRAKLVKEAWDWNWSSAKEHVTGKGESILKLADTSEVIDIPDWSGYLTQRETAEEVQKIRANTLTGRPLGGDQFVEKLEKLFGRRLKALPRGRPRRVGAGIR